MQHRMNRIVRTAAATAAALVAAAVVTAPAAASTTYQAKEAQKDSAVSNHTGGHAFWSPQGSSTFVNNSGKFETFDDGTARLTGTIQFNAQGQHPQFAADVKFVNAMTYDQYMNPNGHLDPNGVVRHGMPKLELKSSAYASNGGSVDPETFTFYYLDETASTLTGLGSISGFDLTLTQRPAGNDYGKMIFMFGEGANGKNTNLGLSGWLSYNHNGQSVEHGDINIDLCPTAVPTPSAAGMGLVTLAGLLIRRRRNA